MTGPEIVPYPGDPRYGVTRDGRVFRILPALQGGPAKPVPYEKTPTVGTNGYPCVSLYAGGKSVPHLVHRMVLETFVGPCPDGHLAAHWDGDRLNPRMENLRWATQTENMQDATRHGTTRRGTRCYFAKLDPLKVQRIRRRLTERARVADIASEFRVSEQTVRRVKNRETWSYV